MQYGDFKNLPRRTAFNKVSRDKKFNIAKNSKYDRYQRGLASIIFAKDYTTNWSENVFMIKKLKILYATDIYNRRPYLQRDCWNVL